MKKKIICLANDFWTDSDEKWGFNLLKKSGYKIELWRVGIITQNFKVLEKLEFNFPVKTVKAWKEFYFFISQTKYEKYHFFILWQAYKYELGNGSNLSFRRKVLCYRLVFCQQYKICHTKRKKYQRYQGALDGSFSPCI